MRTPSIGCIMAVASTVLVVLCGPGVNATGTKLPGDTTVYDAEGKNRVHVKGCRRLAKDPVEPAKWKE